MPMEGEREGRSLIDQPKPTAPVIPETPPPSYSSVISPQQFPVPQVTAPYPVLDYNRIVMPLPAVYTSTSYDPMASASALSLNRTELCYDRNVIGWRGPRRKKRKDPSCGDLCAAFLIVMVIFILSRIAITTTGRNNRH